MLALKYYNCHEEEEGTWMWGVLKKIWFANLCVFCKERLVIPPVICFHISACPCFWKSDILMLELNMNCNSWSVSAYAFCLNWLVDWMSRHTSIHSTQVCPIIPLTQCIPSLITAVILLRIQGGIGVFIILIKPHSDKHRAAKAWWGIIKTLQINKLVVQTNQDH